MKLALAMIVKGTDDEARLLDRCLGNMHRHVDGIFITRTYEKNHKSNKAVGDVAKKYKAHLSDFQWVHDFSAARNFNFSQVPPEYTHIIWSDTDDMWRGLEKLKTTIEKNLNVDGFGVEYLYDWDEAKRPTVVHRKTMIVMNNGCVRWVGRVHEDLHETRELNIQILKGIERLHLTTEERSHQSAERNLEIAKLSEKELPDDPRSQWNLANAQLMVGAFDEAKNSFERFLDRSLSDEEKYLAFQRLSEVYRKNSNINDAIKNLHLAIGVKPELPDAYFTLAQLYYSIGNMDKAEYYSIVGLQRRPQPQTMIVFNPRDYDYNPLMLLARVYFQKNRPDLMLPLLEGCLKIYPDDEKLRKMVKDGRADKKMLGKALETVKRLQKIKNKTRLKAELDKLPQKLRSHPSICVIRNQNFVKTTSTGRDLVYYCGYTTQKWNGETFKTEGVGGSEEAVVHLSREWAKLGWNVTVYNNCGHKEVKSDGVTYKPFWEFNVRDKQDVVIIWRAPRTVDVNINTPKLYIDLHDVPNPGEFTPERLAKIDKIFVKTKFHRSLLPNVPDSKIAVIPNGFQTYPTGERKDPYLIINTSSADRSMDVLPKLFKEVKKQVPQAKLEWAYGWGGFKSGSAGNIKMTEWMNETMKEMDKVGIKSLGRITQEEVGKLYERASVFAYPSEFAEIDCISVKKAQAAGCYPVATDFGALAESNVFGSKIHSKKTKDNWCKPYQFHFGLEDEAAQKKWVDEVVKVLKNPPKFDSKKWSEQFSWDKIAKQWL